MEALRTVNLTRAFADVRAVDGLTLSVSEGEIFGLVGSDGAGKSTVLRMLAAILDPTSGDAWVLGKHTVRDAEAVKEQIGYMGQRTGVYPDLTVLENIHFYEDIYGVPRKRGGDRIARLLAFTNLSPFKGRLAARLSGGMRQKLALCCVLVHTPRLLLLDEPTAGVDPVSRREFWRMLHRLRTTVVITTSYLDEAERCSRIGVLRQGRLVGTSIEAAYDQRAGA